MTSNEAQAQARHEWDNQEDFGLDVDQEVWEAARVDELLNPSPPAHRRYQERTDAQLAELKDAIYSIFRQYAEVGETAPASLVECRLEVEVEFFARVK